MPHGIKDYYAILGVSRSATQEEIKKAFRLKARECHPDVCEDADSEERFKEINEAYEVLSDPKKREVYDRFGTTEPGRGYSGFDSVPFEDIFGMGMEDVFSMFFGTGFGGRTGRVSKDGRDVQVRLLIDLEEAATGVTKEIEFDRVAPCPECDGSGGRNASVRACPQCGGTGRQTVVRPTLFGAMQSVGPCPACGQTGEVVADPCAACGGEGRARMREKVSVEVPAGALDGMSLRVKGKGEAGIRGAASGDLLVDVRIRPHERIFREGDDLHMQVRIPLAIAVLGGKVRFQGLAYEEEVEVPPGTQHGDVLKVKGRGMPRAGRGGAGDLFVHVAVDIPRRLSKKEKDLMREFAEHRGDGRGPAVVDRVRDWLGRR
ncbi:MAG: molecular chaperone DnaJ [Coriobacteriia bacterium]